MSKGDNGDPPLPPPGTCDQLTFETILNPEDETIVSDLTEGATLQVRRQIEQGQELALCYWEEQRVGTVTGPRLGDLLECIKAGNRYVALIRQIDDGLIRAVIRSPR
jgi:hypothetical protein